MLDIGCGNGITSRDAARATGPGGSVVGADLSGSLLILGVVMVYSVFLLAFNLLVDVAYAWVDPRIDVAGGGAGGK